MYRVGRCSFNSITERMFCQPELEDPTQNARFGLDFPMEIIKFACDTEVRLKDLEHARISYVPCGEVDGKDQPLLKFSSLWGKQKRIRRETYGKKRILS